MRQELTPLLRAVSLAALVAGAVMAPAHAQVAAPVDDGALRFFAQQGQMDRVAAELKRLQAAHPGYKQPEDLFKPAQDNSSPEDQPLWDLFGANRLDELHAAIAARMADDPGWRPPAELTNKIKHKEARSRAISLSGDQNWRKLLALANADPDLADVNDVELMWTLAEGYAKSKQTAQALSLYKSLLETNPKPQERLATLQKAMANLRMAEVETLYELGHKGADGVNEFDVIKIDLTRARISAFLHDERKDNVAALDVKTFSEFARKSDDPNQSGLVAWYRYKRREFTEALDWFKFALEHGGDAKIAHGLAHSLRQLRKFREAEEVSYAWRDYDVANSLLFIDLLEMDLTKEIPPYVEDERLARYGRVAAETASGEGAQALARYAYNSCQYHTALEWFQRANAWQPKEATAYGLALAYRRLGDRKNFVETVNRYDGLFPKVVALIFPDDRYLPPTPCEEAVPAPPAPFDASKSVAPPLVGATGRVENQPADEPPLPPDPTTDPTIAYAPGMAPDYPGSIHDPLKRYSWGRVPSPTGAPFRVVEPNYCGDPWQPATFNPNEFPLMVDPQNPLRFAAAGAPTANPAPAAAVAPAPPALSAREPFAPAWPLLARKVSGVGPMPYEHNGFTLQWASLPDPNHKGRMIPTLRFVAPQQIAGFLTRPWRPEAVRVRSQARAGAEPITLAGCAGRAPARVAWPQPSFAPAASGVPPYSAAPYPNPAYAPPPAGYLAPAGQIRSSLAAPAFARAGLDLEPTGAILSADFVRSATAAPEPRIELAQYAPRQVYPTPQAPPQAYPASPIATSPAYDAILTPQAPSYPAPAPYYPPPIRRSRLPMPMSTPIRSRLGPRPPVRAAPVARRRMRRPGRRRAAAVPPPWRKAGA